MKNRGITLIALVVTIIILLILAGVTIGIATNGTGLFEKAKYAVGEYTNAQDKETIEIEKYSNNISNYISNSRDSYPLIIDENEREIGTFNGKKLYQKTFIDREITVTSTSRTWYAIANLDSLNIDRYWINGENSFLYYTFTDSGVNRNECRPLNSYDGLCYVIPIIGVESGSLKLRVCFNGWTPSSNTTYNFKYYVTVTINYTKK